MSHALCFCIVSVISSDTIITWCSSSGVNAVQYILYRSTCTSKPLELGVKLAEATSHTRNKDGHHLQTPFQCVTWLDRELDTKKAMWPSVENSYTHTCENLPRASQVKWCENQRDIYIACLSIKCQEIYIIKTPQQHILVTCSLRHLGLN